jgi:hypothetical protein
MFILFLPLRPSYFCFFLGLLFLACLLVASGKAFYFVLGLSHLPLIRFPYTVYLYEIENRKSADRTEWIIRALKNNPEIDDLRGRVTPLARAIQFAEAYNRGKGRANLDKAVITQLVLQYLEREGLRGTLRLLETESNAVYQPKDIEDTRLTSLLHVSVKDTDQLWSLALRTRTFSLGFLLLLRCSLMGMQPFFPSFHKCRGGKQKPEPIILRFRVVG